MSSLVLVLRQILAHSLREIPTTFARPSTGLVSMGWAAGEPFRPRCQGCVPGHRA